MLTKQDFSFGLLHFGPSTPMIQSPKLIPTDALTVLPKRFLPKVHVPFTIYRPVCAGFSLLDLHLLSLFPSVFFFFVSLRLSSYIGSFFGDKLIDVSTHMYSSSFIDFSHCLRTAASKI